MRGNKRLSGGWRAWIGQLSSSALPLSNRPSDLCGGLYLFRHDFKRAGPTEREAEPENDAPPHSQAIVVTAHRQHVDGCTPQNLIAALSD
jgi:hypothetical protein